MKTLKTFVEKSHIPASLVRAVVRQVGGWDEDFAVIAHDVCSYGAGGGIGGFIYYADTVAFAKKQKSAILAAAAALAADCGTTTFELIASFNCLQMSADAVAEAIYNPRSDNRQTVFNALAWFALEEVARSYCDLADGE